MAYTIQYDIELEGTQQVERETLDEVKEWLQANASSYGWSLDNVEVFTREHIDVYDLMKDPKL